jgi:hypothetical protein
VRRAVTIRLRGCWGWLPRVNMVALPPKPAFAITDLNGGQWLRPNNSLISANGATQLTMQGDGNLVLYTVGCDRRALWASNTGGNSVQGVIMQTDGNLVIYSSTGPALWASNTSGHAGAYLTLQTDGNLVIYGPGALWATGTFAGAAADCSYYVTTANNTTLYNLGCAQGQQDHDFLTNSLAILDFGGQTSDNLGTYLPFSNAYTTYATDESLAVSFAQGYFACTAEVHSTVLTLGIGTNNSSSQVNTTGGSTWANVVTTVRNTVASRGYSTQVTVWGANDMELGYSSQANTLAWVNGYGNGPSYFDYGDAQSCPNCGSGWTQYGVWYKSWGATPAYPVPEIYYQHQADEWAAISQYSRGTQGVTMTFKGPMDQWRRAPSSYSADQAWKVFRDDLASHGVDSSLTYSTSIVASQ